MTIEPTITFETSTYYSETLTNKDYLTEEEALRDDPLTDIMMAVSIEKSDVKLAENRYVYNTGDKIAVKIILRNGYGEYRKRGGDQLRVRIYNETLQAYASGYMIDHNNGTYRAIVPSIWPGIQTISIILAYRREHIRALYHIRKELPETRGIAAIFANGSVTESTACHPVRRWLTQYPDVCNLTRDNGGMSWYCGKPEKLLCQDWSFTKYMSFPELPFTEAERVILGQSWETFPNIKVEVKGSVPESNSLPPCYSYPTELLWNRTEPTGYFINDTWHSLHCRAPVIQNVSFYRPCLQGKRLTITGDSTCRQWYRLLLDKLNCIQITEKWTTEKWHRKSICVVPALNFTLEWTPHAQPFIPGREWDTRDYAIHSIARNIDLIGNQSNVVFVIHMHMHMTASHHSVFRDRMNLISKSVRNLLATNKNVTFMIKGPHTYKITGGRANRLDDFYRYVYKDIMFEEFKELHDKVVFMDHKDMTISKAIKPNHPPQTVVTAAVFQMLNYICEPKPG